MDAMHFLSTRRSRPAKTLVAPAPTDAELAPILSAGLRAPDHGKLEPWRLIVLREKSLAALAAAVPGRAEALGIEEDKAEKMRRQFADAHLAVAVIESPVPSEKIPAYEQTLSAGAVCLQILNAALASGWGANWLSGWASHDRAFVEEHLGLAPHERVAGLVHIGTEGARPPERPRPDPDAKIEWRP